MKKIYLILLTVSLILGFQSCTPEEINEKTPQACCGDDGTIYPPPPPPPPPNGNGDGNG